MEKDDLNEVYRQENTLDTTQESSIVDTSQKYSTRESRKYQQLRALVAGKNNDTKKADVYERKFKNLDNGNSLSWNWCSFLFTPYWLLYRKLYKWFFIYLAVSLAIGSVLTAINSAGAESIMIYRLNNNLTAIESGISFVIFIVAGLFGDRIYKSKLEKLIYQGKTLDQDIKKYGGTSIISVILYILIQLAIAISIGVFFTSVLNGTVL